MIPGVHELPPLADLSYDDDLHVLVITRDTATRYSVANMLLDAGFRVTTAATFGVVEVLLEDRELFDLMVTAQSSEETTQFGVPQLVRSIEPDLPILVLELDSVTSPAVVDLAVGALSRWPLREREARALH